MSGVFSTPRPLPDQRLPLVAGAAVIALALPVFLAAGWELRAWVIGGTLWGLLAIFWGVFGALVSAGLALLFYAWRGSAGYRPPGSAGLGTPRS